MPIAMHELGRTGMRVSVLSMGGAALGDMYGTLAPGEAVATVRYGIDQGINLIDTSPYYGMTRSESVLGEALRDGYRERVFLCTKAGRHGANDFDFSAARITASVDESLQRLGTDYVDVLIAHDIEFASDYSLVFDETAKALHRLKESGKCRFIGMSAYPLGILKQAIEQCQLDVIISYAHFTLQNDRLRSDLLPIAEQHGVGVLNASPLSLGLLTQSGPPPWHPASEHLQRAARQAAEWCHAQGIDIARLGMEYCFAERRIASTITGTAKLAELQTNLQALESVPDAQCIAEVRAIFAQSHTLNESWPSGNWKE